MGFILGAEPASLTCGECGRNFQQDIATARCDSCNQGFCGYDCAMKHQERTAHSLTHMVA